MSQEIINTFGQLKKAKKAAKIEDQEEGVKNSQPHLKIAKHKKVKNP